MSRSWAEPFCREPRLLRTSAERHERHDKERRWGRGWTSPCGSLLARSVLFQMSWNSQTVCRTTLREEVLPSAAARALFGLLWITALVTGAGWRHLLHTIAVFVLITAGAALTALSFGLNGVKMWRHGRKIDALAVTGFFGLMYVLMWLTAVSCFAFSRRRYGQQLKDQCPRIGKFGWKTTPYGYCFSTHFL